MSHPDKALHITPVYQAQSSGYRMIEESVLRDREALATAWNALYDGMRAPPLPAIDFAHESVVVVAAGERTNGGNSVHVDSVRASSTGAVVRYTSTVPGPGCMTTQAITSPVHVVRVPRLPAAVRFERRVVTTPC